ncbi:MAG: NAD-dependent DNA ligase LigA [Lachnospiraceae bacterium]
MVNNKIDRVKELVEQLNYHRDLYYNKSRPEISDFEYDQLFDELRNLEQETGLIMATSPTQTVGYEVKSNLSKVTHNHPMLSLDKTKSVDDVIKFLDGKDGVIMAKMDGLTCSVRYLNGKLVSAETRGNGEVGEDILHCAKTIKNLPLEINCLDEVIIDGEVIITYDDFEKINATLPEDERYKHPRNLASGSIRQLDSSIAAQRNMKFIAWKMVNGYKNNSFYSRLVRMANWGFEIVPIVRVPSILQNEKQIAEAINVMKNWANQKGFPIDGCVFGYDDVAYGESLGATGHHLRSQLAFKFYDELYDTKLLYIDWTMGKTGVLTPTAVFEPVEIDGTEISRASLHNISIIKSLGLTNGCTVRVYKANMIIPQIDSCEQDGDGEIKIPSVCPICGSPTAIQKDNDSEVLICTNPECSGKLLGRLIHFCSKKAMNIDGLSEATLELLISNGYIREFKDIYHLSKHQNELTRLPGLGPKSVEKLLQSIEKSREVKLENFICALGIPNIGLSAAKTISNYCNGDWKKFYDLIEHTNDWTFLDDFGQVMSDSMNEYFGEYFEDVDYLSMEMKFIVPEKQQVIGNPFLGKTLVVTGKLNRFTRDSINEKITSLGAKTTGSVSKNTDYLITNEVSGSSKYKKAVELGIPIITEDEFLEMCGE